MLEYQGRNRATRSATATSEGVDAAASKDRYGRSLPSTQGTVSPSPMQSTASSSRPSPPDRNSLPFSMWPRAQANALKRLSRDVALATSAIHRYSKLARLDRQS